MRGMGAYEAMDARPMKAPAKPKKELEHIRLEEGEDGGHIATHQFTNYDHKPEPHVFGDSEGHQLLSHLIEHGNIKVSGKVKSALAGEDGEE